MTFFHRWLGLASLFCLPTLAEAYPHFIGYGYTSCMTCHYNPLGSGPLTDYGRALGATTMAGASPWAANDEEMGQQSGFLGSVALPAWIRPSAQYRGLMVATDLEREPSARWIHMRADATAVLQFLEDNALIVVGSFGYIPSPPGIPQAGNLVSRDHYIGYRFRRNWGVYAGKMDPAFGVRIPDHIAYSRQKTALAQNDQVHGVMTHFVSKNFEAAAHLFLGNVQQPSSYWQKGGSVTFEFDVVEKFRVGGSALLSFGDYRNRWMTSIHSRIAAGEGSSFLTELGLINEARKDQAEETGGFIMFQSLTRVFRGFHFLMTGEMYTENLFTSDVRYLRVGPGIMYFPFQRVELRADFQASRLWGQTSVSRDSFRLLTQVSLWF